METKEATIAQVWGTVAGYLHGRKVASKQALEVMAARDGGKIGAVQKRHVGDWYSLFETASDEQRVPVAYECGNCNKIIIGPPKYVCSKETVAEDEFGSQVASASSSDIYCGGCNGLMYATR